LVKEHEYLNKEDIELFRRILAQRKMELLREASATIGETISPIVNAGSDFADQAMHETDRNFLLRLRDRERKLITKIDEALKRLEEGTFGICEGCEKFIGAARLKARPVTTYCIECKTRMEEEEKLS
jgi:DnaK suppressor protein